MLHTIYIFAFTVIAFLAISNLIRNLITLSTESNRRFSSNEALGNNSRSESAKRARSMVTHPELLDETGKPINEPLLVMRSVTVEDARQRLDSIYNSSPSKTQDTDGEA